MNTGKNAHSKLNDTQSISTEANTPHLKGFIPVSSEKNLLGLCEQGVWCEWKSGEMSSVSKESNHNVPVLHPYISL